jgi:hypothetical protein
MISIADDLLPRCTVRIRVRDQHSGSGFFVAPQTVATCAHVIESLSRPDRATAAAEIRVVGSDGQAREVDVRGFAPKPESDLALLKLRVPVPHRCVLLDATPIIARDKMHTFAYPKVRDDGVPTVLEDGVPRPFNADGRTGDRRWALGQGQVQRGMSGAPLLNLRTGGVCGVVNRTRGQETNLGGYALPIADLLALEKAVRAENETYHQLNTEWLAALTADQQSGWHAARVRSATAARHFMVTLDETDAGWRVTADDPGDADLESVRVDLNTVKSEVARLFRDWASQHGRVDEDDQVRLLGRILFSAAFPGRIGNRLVELMEARETERVLVGLRFDPDLDREFRELPWEHLCLPEPHDVYMAADPRVSFARVPSMHAGDELPPPSTGPLSVVLMAIGPSDPEQRPSAADRVRDGLVRIAAEPPKLALKSLLNPDAAELETALADHPADVLHYVGFGRFRNGVDQVALGAWGGDIDFIPGDALAESLPDPPPRLVVLEQCSPSPGPVTTDFSVLAPPLLERGVAAVVAFQYLVSPDHTGLFNHAFYRALMAGELVEFALQAGRTRVRQYRRTFVSPALFVRRAGELALVTPGAGGGDQRGGAFAAVNA